MKIPKDTKDMILSIQSTETFIYSKRPTWYEGMTSPIIREELEFKWDKVTEKDLDIIVGLFINDGYSLDIMTSYFRGRYEILFGKSCYFDENDNEFKGNISGKEHDVVKDSKGVLYKRKHFQSPVIIIPHPVPEVFLKFLQKYELKLPRWITDVDT